MSRGDWLTVLQLLATLLSGGLLLSLRSGRYLQAKEDDLTEVKRRLDKAGQEMSDLANEVQKLPDRFRGEFVPRELYVASEIASREDRMWLRRQVETLWEQLRGGSRGQAGG